MKKRNPVFPCTVLLLLCLILGISFVLYQTWLSEQMVFQEIVPLGNMKYDEAFLREAEKIPGIRSVSGVKELPVSLKIGDYKADFTVQILDLGCFSVKTESSGMVTLGSAPVLFVGKNSLKDFSDRNGHVLSQKEQEKLLLPYENLNIMYSCPSAGNLNKPESGTGKWYPCKIGAVLEAPSEGIYLSEKQELSLTGNAKKIPVSGILLEIKGTSNLKKALGYFSAEKIEKN